MIECIFFDCYQTLVHLVPFGREEKQVKTREGWEAFVEALGEHTGKEMPVAEFVSRVSARKDAFYAHNDSAYCHHNLSVIVAAVLQEDFALHLDEQTILALIYEYRKASREKIMLYEGVKDMLDDLVGKYTLALASYTQSSFTVPELQELGIERYFSHSIFSSDIGLRKTSERFYEECLRAVNKRSDVCVMVGDNYDTDVLVPQKLGMQTVWVENPFIDFQSLPPSGQRPNNTVNLKEMSALRGVLEGMS